ncbi:MAG: TatD family hydrolase, partial [candidate division WOR-3 bacterium]
ILSNYCPIRGVVHCFSGDKDVLKRYLDMGLHVSFAGNATYNKNLKEVLKYVPLDRLLVETDSPFLSPLSRRGNRNEPSFVIEVYEYVSTVIGIDVVRLRDTVFANFVTLFGLNL